MNICFYTTERPSVTSALNINYLVQNRPGHNYSFLKIRSAPPGRGSALAALRGWYGRMKNNDGRFEWERDLAVIRDRLAGHVKPIDDKLFRVGFAGAVNDELSIAFLKEAQPDIIIQAGAGILKPETFGLARTGTINLHHGIMPEIRGIESTFWCLFFGIKEQIGVSCHYIDQHIDTGAVITQSNLVSAATTFTDLQTENYLMGRDVLLQGVDLLDKGGCQVKSAGMVKSYYFGNVNPFLYYALKKRQFAPLMKITDKAFKLKEKRYLELI